MTCVRLIQMSPTLKSTGNAMACRSEQRNKSASAILGRRAGASCGDDDEALRRREGRGPYVEPGSVLGTLCDWDLVQRLGSCRHGVRPSCMSLGEVLIVREEARSVDFQTCRPTVSPKEFPRTRTAAFSRNPDAWAFAWAVDWACSPAPASCANRTIFEDSVDLPQTSSLFRPEMLPRHAPSLIARNFSTPSPPASSKGGAGGFVQVRLFYCAQTSPDPSLRRTIATVLTTSPLLPAPVSDPRDERTAHGRTAAQQAHRSRKVRPRARQAPRPAVHERRIQASGQRTLRKSARRRGRPADGELGDGSGRLGFVQYVPLCPLAFSETNDQAFGSLRLYVPRFICAAQSTSSGTDRSTLSPLPSSLPSPLNSSQRSNHANRPSSKNSPFRPRTTTLRRTRCSTTRRRRRATCSS